MLDYHFQRKFNEFFKLIEGYKATGDQVFLEQAGVIAQTIRMKLMGMGR